MGQKVCKKPAEQEVKFVAGNNDEMAYAFPPPVTSEDAEDQLISLAVGLAKQRLQDGTASNQLVAEILRLGTTKERLQKEKLRKENELLRAKTDSLRSQQNTEALYSKVLDALKSYGPSFYDPEYEEDEYDL